MNDLHSAESGPTHRDFNSIDGSYKRFVALLLNRSSCLGSLFTAILVFYQCPTTCAQTVFTAASIPSVTGEFNCAYYSTNADTTVYLSTNEGVPLLAGMGQYWDFSQTQQTNETVLRTDIVPSSAGGDSEYFPFATYAEQDTLASNILGWQYYAITDSGRMYYGLDEPVDNASPEAVFSPVVLDIPSTVALNQSWTNQYNWMTVYYEFLLVSNYCSQTATADCFGNLVLPNIGSVPALRIHEIHAYQITELSDPPTLLDIHTNQYYYWLVPNLGVAVQVLLLGNNTIYTVDLPFTNTVSRFYSANYYTNSSIETVPFTVGPTNLSIRPAGSSIVLSWLPFTNCSAYRIDFSTNLGAKNWQPIATVSQNSWTNPAPPGTSLFRVVGLP